jgi:hypothetical protein
VEKWGRSWPVEGGGEMVVLSGGRGREEEEEADFYV